MRLLKFVFIIFILAFFIAEVGWYQFSNGIAVSLNDILLSVVILVWIANHLLRKQKFVLGKLFKPILLFSVIGLISLLLNFPNLSFANLLVSSLYLVRWIAYALIYVIVSEFEPKFKKIISYSLLFSGSIVVLWGYAQYFFYPYLGNLRYLGWDIHLYRMFSSFLDPNYAGAFFGIFFLYTIAFLRNYLVKKELIKSLLISLISLFTFIALYLTYSRSALIMLLTGVIIYLCLIGKKKFIALAIVLIFLSIFILPKSFTTEGTNFLRAVSSEARIKNAQEALIVIKNSPLYGVGFNAYRYAGNRLGIVTGLDWQVSHGGAGTDNSFLFVLATTGIIGLIVYLNFLYRMIRLGLSNLQRNKYAVVLVSSLAGLFVSSLFINSLFYVFMLEWIWILAAFTEKS
jgi:O-antigen ligase